MNDMNDWPKEFRYAEDFWLRLSSEHKRLLEVYGYESFKRTVNFEYNQFAIGTKRHRAVRSLAWALLKSGRFPLGGFEAHIDFDDVSGIRWPNSTVLKKEHLNAYAFYVGLLWQYAKSKDRLSCLKNFEEPCVGRPLPVYIDGQLISQDIALSALELNRLVEFLFPHPIAPINILEIGAGYGRLAWLFKRRFPQVNYHILDIEPARSLAEWYLKKTLDEPVEFVTYENVMSKPEGWADIIINISSFDEMPTKDVVSYFDLIDHTGGRLLYLQGYRDRNEGGSRIGVSQFPYRTSWKNLYRAPYVPIPGFEERVYAI